MGDYQLICEKYFLVKYSNAEKKFEFLITFQRVNILLLLKILF